MDFEKKFLASMRHQSRAAISSDQGDAIQQLRAKLEDVETRDRNLDQLKAVASNKKLSVEEKERMLLELGLSKHAAEMGARRGWAAISYSRQNLRQEKKRIEDRIATLEKESARSEVEVEVDLPDGNALRVLDSPEKNRIQLFFTDRISSELAATLKGRGFRWAPSEKAWQRQRTDNARWAVKALFGVDLMNPQAPPVPTAPPEPTAEQIQDALRAVRAATAGREVEHAQLHSVADPAASHEATDAAIEVLQERGDLERVEREGMLFYRGRLEAPSPPLPAPPPPPPVFRPAEGFRPAQASGQVGALFEDVEPAPLVPALEALQIPVQWQGDFLEAYGIAPELFFAIRGVAPARIGSEAAAYFDRAENDDDELDSQIREAASQGLVLLQVGQPASTVENEGEDSDDWEVFSSKYALENNSDIRDISSNPAWIVAWADLGEAQGGFYLGAIRALRAFGREEVKNATARNIFFASWELAPSQVGAEPGIPFPSATGKLSGKAQRALAGFGLEAYEIPMEDARRKAILNLLRLREEMRQEKVLDSFTSELFQKELDEAIKTTGKRLEDFTAPPPDEDEERPPLREEAPRELLASTIRPFSIDPSSLVLAFPRDRLEVVTPTFRGNKLEALVLWKTPHRVTVQEVTYQRDSRGRTVRQESPKELPGELVLCQYVGRGPWLFWVPANSREEWICLAAGPSLPVMLAIAMHIPRIARTKDALLQISDSPTMDRPESIKTEAQARFVELLESARQSVVHVMPRSPVAPSAVVFASLTGKKLIQSDGSLRDLEGWTLLCPPSISGKEGAEKPLVRLYSAGGQSLAFQPGSRVGFPMGYPETLIYRLGLSLARATQEELRPLFQWLAEGYGMALCSLLTQAGDDFGTGKGEAGKALDRWTDFQDQIRMVLVPVMSREEDAKILKERADKQNKAMMGRLVAVHPNFDDKDLHNNPMKHLKRYGGATGVSRVFFSGDTFTGKITITSEDGTVRILDMGDKLTGEVKSLPMAAIIRVLAAQPKEILWGLTQTNRVERNDFGPDFRADVSSIAVGFLNELRDQVVGPSNLFWSNRRVPELVEGLRAKNNKAGYYDGSLIHLPTGLSFMTVPNQKIAQIMLSELPPISWEEADYFEGYQKSKLHERRGELQAMLKRLVQIDEDSKKVERILKPSGSLIRPSLDVESLEDWSKRLLSTDERIRRNAERGLDALISEARNPPARKRGERRPTVAKKIQELPVGEWIGVAVAVLPQGNLADAILEESAVALINTRNALGLLPDPGRPSAPTPAPAPSWKLGLSEEEYVRLAFEAGKAERLSGRAPRGWRTIQEEQGIPTGPHYRAAEEAYMRGIMSRTSNPDAGPLQARCKATREEIRALESDQRALVARLLEIKRQEIVEARVSACDAPKKAIRDRYDAQIDALLREASALEAQARGFTAREKDRQRQKLPELTRASSDALIGATLGGFAPELLPHWEQLRGTIDGPTALARLEVFLKFVEDNPQEIREAPMPAPAPAPAPRAPRAPRAPKGKASRPPLTPARILEVARTVTPISTDLVNVAPVMRVLLAEGYPLGEVQAAVLLADREKLLELTADAGVGKFSREDLAILPPGPRGMFLAHAHLLTPAQPPRLPPLTSTRILEVAAPLSQGGLVNVAPVMRSLLAEGYPLGEVQAAVLLADREQRWQLRADAGVGRFFREDLAILPPGPRGTYLVTAQIRTPNPSGGAWRVWREDGQVKASGPFSLAFQRGALELGGRWNRTGGFWFFDPGLEAQVRALSGRTENPGCGCPHAT
jgi:hypothetical protein